MKKNKPAQSYIKKLLCLIDTQINFVERLLLLPNNHDPLLRKIKWHGSQIEFVELVYALHETGSLGKTTLKKAFSLLGDFFDFEIQDYYRQFWGLRNRVAKERTFFLNKLRKGLEGKWIEWICRVCVWAFVYHISDSLTTNLQKNTTMFGSYQHFSYLCNELFEAVKMQQTKAVRSFLYRSLFTFLWWKKLF